MKAVTAKLLTWPDDQTKFRHTSVPIVGVSLLPHRLAFAWLNLCSHSTIECRKHCLNFCGKGSLTSVQRGRGWKTQLLVDNPLAWFTLLWMELEKARLVFGPDLRCRLNVFSDIAWERLLPAAFWQEFSDIRFLDYTKNWTRGPFPSNYRIAWSTSERTSWDACEEKLFAGGMVCIVCDWKKGVPFPSTFRGWPLVDNDTHDDIWSRRDGVILGVRAKGALRSAESPFKWKLGEAA